ncbi:MAG: glutamate--tRNA ligase [bacterium]|nr:glutamate--tRNA ligase [bacterium]
MNTNHVVTRFAPSPSGYMHIGNLRTALYSYLLAKSNGGTFILRIEDTDRKRLVENAVQIIYDTLQAAGLNYDEGPGREGANGPYVQSERIPIYLDHAKRLISSGHAYYCFCDSQVPEETTEETGNFGYNRHCRNHSPEEVSSKLSSGVPHVIRQKVPLDGATSFDDMVFGNISRANADLQDIVLIKSDGYPTYNFAHVVDDFLMGVTHVVRGSEYLSSTPQYVLLYDAFGWKRPHYVHLPLIMGKGEDGTVSKLSKRHGAVSFQDLVQDGYLPESIVNYIALLGWSPKETTEEFFTLEELAQRFKVTGINKSSSIFDYEKLLWFNGNYIRKLTPEKFSELATPHVKKIITRDIDMARLMSLIQPRIEKFSQIPQQIGFFEALPEFDCELFVNKGQKATLENTVQVLPAAIDILNSVQPWKSETLFENLKKLSADLGLKAGSVMWAVRIAISGTSATPGGATDILEILGQQESLRRLSFSLDKVKAHLA